MGRQETLVGEIIEIGYLYKIDEYLGHHYEAICVVLHQYMESVRGAI